MSLTVPGMGTTHGGDLISIRNWLVIPVCATVVDIACQASHHYTLCSSLLSEIYDYFSTLVICIAPSNTMKVS